MATQEGFGKFRGKQGDIIFYLKNGNYFSRAAPSAVNQSKDTKKSSNDFATNNGIVRTIQIAFKPLMAGFIYTHFYHRLNKLLLDIIYDTPKELLGQRKLTDGNISRLRLFEFNKFNSFHRIVFFTPAIEIDPYSNLTLSIPKLKIEDSFLPHKDAVAVVLRFRCCVFNFETQQGGFTEPNELVIALNKTYFPGGSLDIPMEGAENCVLILGVTAHYLRIDSHTGIQNRQYYAGRFLEAVHIRDGKIVTYQPPPPTIEPDSTEPGHNIQWKLNEETD